MGKGPGPGTYARKEETMIILITLTIGIFIGGLIAFISAAVLALGKYSDESVSKSFADWLILGVYLDEKHLGLRPS